MIQQQQASINARIAQMHEKDVRDVVGNQPAMGTS